MKFLHITEDQRQIDVIFNQFERAAPGLNSFACLAKNFPLKHVRKAPVEVVSQWRVFSSSFLRSLREFDAVFLHGLGHLKAILVAWAPRDVNFVWMGWGGDYYHLIAPHTTDLFEEKTAKLYRKLKQDTNFQEKAKEFILTNVFRMCFRIAINKIAFFAPVLPEEFPLILERFPHFSPQFLDLNYGWGENLEEQFLDLERPVFENGENILIGNSANFENNHLEAFEKLKLARWLIPSSKIFCPLSYGNMTYRGTIRKIGNSIFGTSFQSLEAFLPMDQYAKILSTCGIGIMNHVRQQAMGNILLLLFEGAKVFLNPKSPAFKYFHHRAIPVFPLDSLCCSNPRLSKKKLDDRLRETRIALRKHFCCENTISKIKMAMNKICSVPK